MLCKRHGAGVKPAVNHFRHTFHRLAAFRTGHCDFIDIRTMQFNIGRLRITAHFHQFLTASDSMLMATFTFPDIQRRTPVTVTADAPVLNIFQPVAETAFTDTFRNPVDRIVIADQIILHLCHFDEPGFSCIIDQRCIAAPAVWIAVFKFRRII